MDQHLRSLILLYEGRKKGLRELFVQMQNLKYWGDYGCWNNKAHMQQKKSFPIPVFIKQGIIHFCLYLKQEVQKTYRG